MERITKIIFITFFVCFSLLSNAWSVILGLSIVIAFLAALFSKNYFSILIPVTYVLISFVGQSYLGLLIGGVGIYIFRCVINDDTFNHHYHWPIFFGLLSIGTYLYAPFILAIPIVLTIIVMPITQILAFQKKKRTIIVLSFILYASIIILSAWGYGLTKKRAYLQHGVWAKASPNYSLDTLNNSSCYSYSEFVKLLGADTINDLQHIEQYNELWIVTPTKPFSDEQISTIRKWVVKGGNLIVVSDHTDLYGHARCTNQIASVFGCSIHNSATFDVNNNIFFNDAFSSTVNIKTATNMTGLAFPVISSWLWEESAYYANNNFFGPLAASGDDSFGIKMLAGQLAYGLGQVSFLQDSTVFANFAVYQPYVMDIANVLSRHSFVVRLFLLFPFLFAFCLWVFAMGYRRVFISLVCVTPLFLPFNDCKPFDYGSNPQLWSGNHDFIIENGCYYTNISTAYSLAALSERKPLWNDNINLNEKDVIWVDSTPPPNSQWRWVKVQDLHKERDTINSVWDSLYTYLEVPNVKSWNEIFDNYQKLEVNAIFSDNVMNDWWYNDGISKNRYARIKAWLAWVNKKQAQTNVDSSIFTKDKYRAVIRAKDKNAITINLPKPEKNHDHEIYFGNGVTGYVVVHGDTLSIFGKKQYSENIFCPEIWTIDYME